MDVRRALKIAISVVLALLAGTAILVSIQLFELRVNPPMGLNREDSALFMDVERSIIDGKGFTTQYGASILTHIRQISAFGGGLVDPSTFEDGGSSLNEFKWHAYTLLIPQSLLAEVLGSLPLQAFLLTLTWLVPVGGCLLVTAHLFQRYTSRRVHLGTFVSAIALTISVAQFPGVRFSAMGQFYPDRVFLIVFPVHFAIAASRNRLGWRHQTRALVITGLVLLMISERSAMYLALGSLFLLSEQGSLHKGLHNWTPAKKMHLLGFLLSATWVVIYLAAVTTNTDSSGYIHQLLNPDFDAVLSQLKRSSNLLVFSLPLAVLGVRGIRHLCFAAAAIAPNVIGSVAGAEKSGWTTHYLTYWSGFLIGLAVYSVLRSRENIVRLKSQGLQLIVLSLVIAGSSFINITLNPFNLSSFSSSNRTDMSVTGYAYRSLRGDNNFMDSIDYRRRYRQQIDSVLATLPRNATISAASPYAFDSILNDLETRLYPIGILDSEYVILKGAVADGRVIPDPTVVYVGGSASSQLNEYLNTLLNSEIFVIEHYDSQFGYILLRRNTEYLP